jgi:2-hydroxychromene-2-carboxylate isomerase
MNPDGALVVALALVKGLAGAGLFVLPPDWEEKARAAIAAYRAQIPPEAWAEAYYRIAYEAGANMGRIHRARRLVAKALELNPSHPKALLLQKQLDAQPGVHLTGD